MFTEGTVTSVRATTSGPDPLEVTRQRLRRNAGDALPDRVAVALLGAIAYIPLLVTRPGAVAMDTHDGLYLDPRGTLRIAAGRWDAGAMFGAIADRTDGFAFPMAPWFWIADLVGLPTWFAQRWWLGSILFLGGLGVIALLRGMQWIGPGKLAAAVAYMLSPYVAQYIGTRSAVLLAWAGLPWLIHFAVRSLARDGWADPARFGLVAALATGGNLAASLYLLVGPTLWLLYVGVGTHEVDLRTLRRAIGRITLIGLAVSLWLLIGWTFAPGIEIDQAAAHDPPLLSRQATAAGEALRGLGDWRTYGSTSPLGWYVGSPLLIVVSYIVPAVGLSAIAAARLKYRLFVVSLLVVGCALAVGAGPEGHPQAMARVFRVIIGTDLGRVIAPTARAVPLVGLALAIGFGAGVRSVIVARPSWWWGAQIAAGAVVVAGTPMLVTARSLDGPRLLTGGVPAYWEQAAAATGASADANVLVLGGDASSIAPWGTTAQPVAFALLDDPVAARMSSSLGQRGVRDLVAAIDDQLRQGTLEAAAVAPLARLMAVDSIVVPDELVSSEPTYPDRVIALLRQAPGLTDLGRFGATDERSPGVVVFRVGDVPARLRVATSAQLRLSDADGRGLVELANAGVLSGDELLLPTEELRSVARAEAVAGAPVLLTDGNRRELRRPTDPVGSVGPTEPSGASVWGAPAGERLGDPSRLADERLATAETAGVRVGASGYGSPHRLHAADRPTMAIDGDPATGWRVGRGRSPVGHRLSLAFDQPVSVDALRLRQAAVARAITAVHLEFDGYRAQDVVLTSADETIPMEVQSFRTLTIEISAVAAGPVEPGAGFTEVALPGVDPRVETVVLPDDLLRIGDPLAFRPVTVVLSRWRDDTAEVDPERSIRRRFATPIRLRLEISGTARTRPDAPAPAGVCAPGLVMINGRTVDTRLEALGEGRLRLVACGAVDVLPGSVEVITAGAEGDVVVDRLVLHSSTRTEATNAPLDTPAPQNSPRTTVNLAGSTGMTIRLDRASPAVWAFRAAGHASGWVASIDGQEAEPGRPANGFGTAWLLPVGDGREHEVAFRIPAQRRVGLGVLGSAVAAVVAITLARPRRRGSGSADAAPRPAPDRHGVPLGAVGLCGLALFGVVAGVLPMAVAGMLALGMEYRRGRSWPWLAFLPGGLLLAAGIAKAGWSVIADTPAGPEWASATPWIDALAWTAVAVAFVIALRPRVARAAPRPATRPPATPPHVGPSAKPPAQRPNSDVGRRVG